MSRRAPAPPACRPAPPPAFGDWSAAAMSRCQCTATPLQQKRGGTVTSVGRRIRGTPVCGDFAARDRPRGATGRDGHVPVSDTVLELPRALAGRAGAVSRPLLVQFCEGCGWGFFPARLSRCPGCGASSLRFEAAGGGVVEEVTSRRRDDGSTVHIASVRATRGPVVIARASAGIAPGARVELEDDDGAPVARAAD